MWLPLSVPVAERHSSMDMRIAQAVREACVEAARAAYEDAATSGLCSEGAREAALSAMESLDLQALLTRTRG